MKRYELHEAAWRRLLPLLPPERSRHGGRPALDRQRTINGILWVLRTGSPWRDLPERYGPWSSVANTFCRWRTAGVWDRVLAELQRRADTEGRLDWSLHHVDSTVVRAHQHAAGARRAAAPGGEAEALGRPRGGLSTKVHVRCDREGRPLCFHLTGGAAADYKPVPFLLDRWGVRRAGPGRPRRRPERLVADRAYSNRHVRDGLRRRRIGAVIPQPRGQRPRHLLDRAAYRGRNVIERPVGRLKQFRRVATRYGKRAANYLAMLQIAAVVLWLKP